MTDVCLWHNPRCSKSRQTLELLRAHGADVTERRYLDDAPNEAEIRAVLDKLGVAPIAMMRPKEALFKELGLTQDSDPDSLIHAMAAHPQLIERPIAIRGNKARLGRPPEQVLDLL